MKIKELFENITEPRYFLELTAYLDAIPDEQIVDIVKQEIANTIKSEVICYKYGIQIITRVELSPAHLNDAVFKLHVYDEVNHIVLTQCEKYTFEVIDFYSDLVCQNIPKHIIQSDFLTIELAEPSNISTISKFVKRIDRLVIANSENITGGLLSLLDTDADNIVFVSNKVDRQKMLQLTELFNEQFKGEQNKAKLQTSLFKNGFKAFA